MSATGRCARLIPPADLRRTQPARSPGETGPPGILAQRRRRPRPLRAPPEPRQSPAPGAKAPARRRGGRMRKGPCARRRADLWKEMPRLRVSRVSRVQQPAAEQ